MADRRGAWKVVTDPQRKREYAQRLDQANQTLRADPRYVEYLQSLGANLGDLNDRQRKQAEAWVRENLGDMGSLEIDKAGNMNQNEGLGKQLSNFTPALIAAGGALTGAGLFGAGPLGGVLGIGGGGAGASAPAVNGITTALPGAVTGSQGASAAVTGANMAAGGSGIMKALNNPLIMSLVGGALGLLGGDDGQELTPYRGDVSPQKTLERSDRALRNVAPGIQRRAAGGVKLRSAYAQQPPQFSGGGLPMNIGVTGMDPALMDKSLLELPGLDLGNFEDDEHGTQAALNAIDILRGRK